MITCGLLIWIGAVVGMPTGYFVICGLGIAAKIVGAFISAVMKAGED